jgi:hypothetical protein
VAFQGEPGENGHHRLDIDIRPLNGYDLQCRGWQLSGFEEKGLEDGNFVPRTEVLKKMPSFSNRGLFVKGGFPGIRGGLRELILSFLRRG